MSRKVVLAAALSVVLGIMASGVCFGQIKSASITGRVTDSSGAVIPAASVSVINEGTKVPADTHTSGTGDYTVPFLEPGIYDVNVTKEGFTTYAQTGVSVGVGDTIRVDAQLSVGRTATVVEVKGENAVALQTETSTVGDTVDTQAIAELPDINHNPFYFATLQPGVSGKWEMMQNNNAMSFGIGIYSQDDYSAFSVNGGATFTASITVDGVNVQGASWNESDINPAPEAVQEVKTYTNDFDASIGRGQGAVAIVTKSGTNNFHGAVFGRLRNEALNANSFSNDVQLIPKAPFKVIYYGGALGGPIVKNKAFFFFSWQGMAHNSARQDLLNVPNNNQAKGDFSSPEGCTALNSVTGTPSSNNLGTCVSVGGTATPLLLYNDFMTIGSPASGVYQHPLITGPNGPSDLTQVADPGMVHWFSYYPASNRFPTDQYNDNNYYFQGLQTYRSQTISSRVDLNHGKHNIYFAGGIEWGTIHTPSPWGKETPQFFWQPGGSSQITALVYSHTPYGSIGDTFAVSPTLIIDMRLGVQRPHYTNMNPVVPGVNYNLFSMPANYQAILLQPGAAPDNGTSPIGQWTALNDESTGHKNPHQTNYHFASSATKVKGNWTLKFGGEYLGDLTNAPNPYYTGGYLEANGCGGCEYAGPQGAGSSAYNTTAQTQGLGYVGDTIQGSGWWYSPGYEQAVPALEEQYLALYSQNTWKVTPRLTLNLGVRWDLQPGPTDRFNRMTAWNDQGTNPIGMAAGIGAQGAYYFAGQHGTSRHLWETEYTNFAPRIGVAYRVTDSLVVRGGYGISFLPTNTGLNFGPGPYGMWPYAIGTTENSFGANPSGVPIGPMEDPAATSVVQPVGANPAAPNNYGVQTAVLPRNYQNGYMQQFNFFVEKRVGNWLLSAGYSGSLGSRLPVSYNLVGENTSLYNAPSVSGSNVINCFHAGLNCGPSDSKVAMAGGYLATGSDPYSQQVANPFNPTGTLPFQGPYIAATIPRGLLDGNFPLMAGQSDEESVAFSKYNSLQVEAKHQFSHGLMLDVFYTWSKDLEDSYFRAEHDQTTDSDVSVAWDQICKHCNQRYGIDDTPGRFVANLVYDLPFGAGHSMNPGNKVASYLASGWSIGATEMDQSGFPLDIYDNDPGALDSRPNRAPGEPLLAPKSLQHWYNGKTTVTLPDGRQITPANFSFLKYNPDAFMAPTITIPSSGKIVNDTYWIGTSAINYGSVRDPSINNLNFTLKRAFKVTERVSVEAQANASNLLNHPNIETYTSDLGSSTELTPNNSKNIPIGFPTNSTNSYGTHGLTTFDYRQIELQLRVKF